MIASTLTLMALSPALAGDSLPERLADRATAPDVILVPPVSEPSPKIGSFVVLYEAPADGPVDDERVGTYSVAPSSCSEVLTFKTVEAVEKREELWLLESGIGLSIGVPAMNIGVGVGKKSIAGVKYNVTEKLILDGGLKEFEECCLRSPDKCTDTYISEYWHGMGAIHRIAGSNSAIKSSLKQLDKLGRIEFGSSSAWTMSSDWDKPMYFAYRTTGFQLPDCESYMNDLSEVEGKVLFTGVSARVASEQKAREDARMDARKQVVKYLGEELKIEGDDATSRAEAVLSGVKDSLTCLDATTDTPEGPAYLARVRMYAPTDKLEGKEAEMKSGMKK